MLPFCEALGAGAALVAAGTDLRWRRIPDRLTRPLLAFGLVAHAALALDASDPWIGAGGLFGAALAPAPFLWANAIRPGAFGGGDLKLLAALGALRGVAGVPDLILRVAVAGGLLALLALVREWAGGAANRTGSAAATLPYGVAIAAGMLWALAG